MKENFDLVFENPLNNGNLTPKSVANILFDELPGRNNDSKIILSHFENQYIEVSLGNLRSIVCKLIRCFEEKKITKGQTVILLTFQGCNEMLTAIFLIALAVKGCRTFLPMYSESEEFSEWIDRTHTEHIIIPDNEIKSLEGHDMEKRKIEEIRLLAALKHIRTWDNILDFGILEILFDKRSGTYPRDTDVDELLSSVSAEDEALIVTTSGTSGKSKLVVYTHAAYYLNCLAWQQAGLYDCNLLGGTGFTPMITHTMGIRALMNALWTGYPVCLIITEWFITKPETVRYLLLKMKPEHITGGPAVYNTFLEFFRRFPEIKIALNQNLKTLVSSGAKYDPVTAGEVNDATGLPLHNAFGTTETQQVFSILLSKESLSNQELTPLGKPLPGVSIALRKSDHEQNHYKLNIKSVFGHKYCIGEEHTNTNGYFETGDVVYLDDKNCFYYVRLANRDYFKDSFGVKIPVAIIKRYYHTLLNSVLHAEFYSVTNSPGLALLLFIKDDSIPGGLVTENGTLKKFSGNIEELNNRLINKIEPFEFQHRHVCRIAILNQSPPRTGKGTVSVKRINVENRELIGRLTDTRKDICGIETTDKQYQSVDKYTRYISPKIGALMSSLKLNYSYHRCKKDTLFSYKHGKELEILDVTGGYGTNLLGYYNPVICNAVTDFISSGKVAICNQLSVQNQTGLLAEKLNLVFGSETGRSYQVVFGNSGSEAVEIAIHHAFFEWGKRIEKIRDQQVQIFGSNKSIDVMEVWNRNTSALNQARVRIIALANSFHGHTTGARSLLGNRKKRLTFSQLVGIDPVFLDDTLENRLQMLKTAIEDSQITLERIVQIDGVIKIVPFTFCTIIAAIAEPVQGEGGVHEVDKDFLRALSLFEFPLISDEIQCGLGRTGDLPECKHAHYYLLGKALGGGLEKISAVLIDKSRYHDDFCEYYASTFGNGELAATAGIAVIDQLTSGSLLQKIRETGDYLHERLTDLSCKYPTVIQNIKGKGLMLAVYFNPECMKGAIFLRVLLETEKAGYLFSAWLLNRHHIRMLPSLSAPFALRLEPSVYFTREETDKVFEALDELCSILQNKKLYDLFSFLMDDDTFNELSEITTGNNFYQQNLEKPDPNAINVAFIAHFALPLKELKMLEPEFSRASDTGLRILFNRFQTLLEMDPIRLIAFNLFHGKVHFTFYIIPIDSSELEYLHKSGRRKKIVTKIQKAVNLSVENGAQIISLGGYTSILTNNGLSLYEPPNTKIITGNTLTAASGLIHLRNTIKQSSEFNKPNIIAIVGSSGNIGQVITEILCEQSDICSELLLVSRCKKRLSEFIAELGKKKKALVKITSSSINDIKNADIIIVCSNTNDPIVFPHHIAKDKPVLISDLSVPSAVSSEVNNLLNVKTLPFSAYVTLPEDENAVISSYSPPGTVFCCAGEAILLGLERFNGSLKGKILPEEVRAITELAQKHNILKNIGNMDSFKTSKSFKNGHSI